MRATTQLTPLPNLIEIFKNKMDNPEPIEDAVIDILPLGLPLWLNIILVMGYVAIVIFFSYRIMDRKRLT